MRVIDIQERTVSISRYADASIASGGLTTSIVAIRTDAQSGPTIGYGFTSIGRFAQRGLIEERFAPRLLGASAPAICDTHGELDPVRAWTVMMASEKAGGHGERCVAVGALDMALWDLAAKRATLPLAELIAERFGTGACANAVDIYASGGYLYPMNDENRLNDELTRMRDMGFTSVKIKIGAASLADDMRRIAQAVAIFGSSNVAVDAMNSYDGRSAIEAADAVAGVGLRWFEDVCDPHDFRTQQAVTARYPGAIAAGEALFSAQEAVLLADFGGLRTNRDILLFDPAHCYGLTGFVRIVGAMTSRGWPRSAFWPHGGHLFTVHVAAGLDLGGAEVNPFSFAPFGGLGDDDLVVDGRVVVPRAPGIGFERRARLRDLFYDLMQ